MSDETTAPPIDLTAPVAVPEGEVSREELVEIFEAARKGGDEEQPAAVEPPKPEPPKPEVEKVSARILAANKAEQKARAARQVDADARAAIAKEREAVAEDAKQAAALKAAKTSPSKALELLGMSPKEFLESLATEHEPETVAKRVSEETTAQLLARLDAAEAREKARDAADAERTQRARHAEIQQATQQGGEVFTEYVAANAEKYPALVETWTPAQFVREGFACLEEVLGHRGGKPVTRLQAYMEEHDGEAPSEEEIAELLEARAQPVFQQRSAWRERIGKSAPIPSQGASANQGQPVMAAKPRTLTNGASATNASAPKPWSQKDADDESVRLIEQLHASRNST